MDKLNTITCWFSEIYSGNPEKAQLVSILISSIVAVVALITNQWVIRRTARNELMLAKCEKGYNLAVQLNVLSMEWTSSVLNQDESQYFGFKAQFFGVAQELEGICSLYFPKVSFDKEVIENFSSNIALQRKVGNFASLTDIQSELDSMLRGVCESFKDKSQQYRH